MRKTQYRLDYCVELNPLKCDMVFAVTVEAEVDVAVRSTLETSAVPKIVISVPIAAPSVNISPS